MIIISKLIKKSQYIRVNKFMTTKDFYEFEMFV